MLRLSRTAARRNSLSLRQEPPGHPEARPIVRGGTHVILVPAILNPFPNVAVHVVKSKCVRLERSGGRRLFEIPLSAAAIAVGVAGARFVTPGIAGIGATAGAVLPFGLAQEPVLLASDLNKPGDMAPSRFCGREPFGRCIIPIGKIRLYLANWLLRRGGEK